MWLIKFIKQIFKTSKPNHLVSPKDDNKKYQDFVITLMCKHYPISKSYSVNVFQNIALYEEKSAILFTGLMKISMNYWAYKSALEKLIKEFNGWLEQMGKSRNYKIIDDINELNEILRFKEVQLYEIYFEAFDPYKNKSLIIEKSNKCDDGKYPIFEKAQIV